MIFPKRLVYKLTRSHEEKEMHDWNVVISNVLVMEVENIGKLFETL
jgi:hypothetical protein